eukprot:403335769
MTEVQIQITQTNQRIYNYHTNNSSSFESDYLRDLQEGQENVYDSVIDNQEFRHSDKMQNINQSINFKNLAVHYQTNDSVVEIDLDEQMPNLSERIQNIENISMIKGIESNLHKSRQQPAQSPQRIIKAISNVTNQLKLNILVVDDIIFNILVMEELLNINMPVLDGYETIDKILQKPISFEKLLQFVQS